jgi:hypothetical protein
MNYFIKLIILTTLIGTHGYSGAFQLWTEGTLTERQYSATKNGFFENLIKKIELLSLDFFTTPVHEEITHKIYGCDADISICSVPEAEYATKEVIAGVRWNDDPPFRLNKTAISECKVSDTIRFITQTVCWIKLFKHAEKTAAQIKYDAANGNANLMYRSHFGDLQFIHAMATSEAETNFETKQKIMLWMEFTWRASKGEYKNNTLLKDIKINGFEQFFGKSGWSIQDLFTLGNPHLQKHLPDVAFGSLLHTVQDSFSKSHVDRLDSQLGELCPLSNAQSPGKIAKFYSYQNQDHDEHAKEDKRNALAAHLISNPNVITIGKQIRTLSENSANLNWDQVKPYFDCIFNVQPGRVGS